MPCPAVSEQVAYLLSFEQPMKGTARVKLRIRAIAGISACKPLGATLFCAKWARVDAQVVVARVPAAPAVSRRPPGHNFIVWRRSGTAADLAVMDAFLNPKAALAGAPPRRP
jgi:hypothetical protein